jgi:hypothetical protein
MRYPMAGRNPHRGHFERARLPETIRVEIYSTIAVDRANSIVARRLEAI